MDKNRIAELEVKWLNGTISDEEAKEYAQWYNSAQNEPVVIPEHIARSKEEHKVKILEGLLQKLDQLNGNSEQKNIPFTPWYKNYKNLSIAASILIIMGITTFWILNKTQPQNLPTMVQDKEAGTEGLLLSLDNGEIVEIDSLKDGLIANQDGVQIYKKEGTLYYKGEAGKTTYNTASTPKGRKFEIQLPDGSSVWLNAESSIKYPIKFKENERKVELKGEAYFEVVKNDRSRFIVETNDQTIEVLGTHFNVNSYTEENSSKTTLVEGKVKVICQGENIYLNPNEQISFDRKEEKISKTKINAMKSIGWVEGVFNFQDSDLATVMRQIGRWYNIEVVFEQGVDQNQTFSGKTSMNQNLSEVLKVLELSGIHSQIKNNTLFITP